MRSKLKSSIPGVDCQSTSKKNDVTDSFPDESECGECNSKIDTKISTGGLCSVCSFRFCSKCLNNHDQNMKSKFPYVPENKTQCGKTRRKEVRYCKNFKCGFAMCQSCEKSYHKGHDVVNIAAHASQCWMDRKEIATQIKIRYNQIKKAISRIEAKKIAFEKNAGELKLLIKEKHQNVINFVNRIFDQQQETFGDKYSKLCEEFSSNLKMLEIVKDEIRETLQVNSHIPPSLSNYEIVKFDKRLRYVGNAREVYNVFLCEYKSLSIGDKYPESDSLKSKLQTYFGSIDTTINEIVVTNKDHAYIFSFDRKFKDEVNDICYDIERDIFFVLVKVGSQHYIVKLSAGHIEKFFIDSSYRNCKRISLFLNSSILLHYESSLAMISEDLKKYGSLPDKVCQLNNVSTICSSTCKDYIYICCKNRNVFRYNQGTNEIDETTFPQLPGEANWMSVSEHSQHIAFAGMEFDGVYLGLYDEAIVKVVRDTINNVYTGLTFSSNILIAFNKKTKELQFICLEGLKRCIRKVQFLYGKNVPAKFSSINAITMSCLNSLYFTDSAESDAIYTLVFE